MTDYTEPLMDSAALLTIDTQCDTLDGQPFEIPGTSAALPNIRRLLDAFRAVGRPIVHIVRIYKPDGSNVDICRRGLVEDGAKLVIEGADGCQIATELFAMVGIRLDEELLMGGGVQHVSTTETIIYKPRWGAFYQTPLEDHLRAIGTTTLVFSGCNFPNCPRTSIYEASERDFRIVLASDAVSGLYDRGAAELERIGVRVMDTESILRML